MSSPHDLLLERLHTVGTVRLLARLDDPAATGNTSQEYLHVFVPDLHLVSTKTRPRFKYGFDHAVMFSRLIDALLLAWDDVEDGGGEMRVTQLGDFVDLWRESDNDLEGIRTVLDSFPDIRDRFVRNAADSIGANLLLGNHDLEAGQSRAFSRARMSIHLPGVDRTMMATHGDRLDWGELAIADPLAAWAVFLFGRLASPATHTLKPLQDLRDAQMPKDLTHQIQGDGTVEEPAPASDKALPPLFNVAVVTDPGRRSEAHSLLPHAIDTAKELRTTIESDGKPIAADLKVMVIGHSHHPRMVHDPEAGLVLMDCGAWIESYQVGKHGEKKPNRQLGVTCGSDLRIYQIDD